MKMNKKGFTLIELLATIVILAIIAVITVPIILNIIDNARKGAAKDSVGGYGKSIETAYVKYMYDKELDPNFTEPATGTNVMVDTQANVKKLNVEYDGTDVTCTSIAIVDGKVYMYGCHIGTDTTTGTAYYYAQGKVYSEDDTGYVATIDSSVVPTGTSSTPAAQEEPGE